MSTESVMLPKHLILDYMGAKSLQLCLTLCDLWTVARQAPLYMGFSGQEYWSGLPFPSPEDLPHPAMEPTPPWGSTEPPGKPFTSRCLTLPDSQSIFLDATSLKPSQNYSQIVRLRLENTELAPHGPARKGGGLEGENRIRSLWGHPWRYRG